MPDVAFRNSIEGQAASSTGFAAARGGITATGAGMSAGELSVGTVPGIAVHRPAKSGAGILRKLDRLSKRTFDVVLAVVLLVASVPLLLLAAIAIKLDSPGPIFFRVERVGYNGRRLRMLKFRKMHDGAQGISLTVDDDARLTRVGAWLTRLKLDELPQVWHVLKGEMSFVGPRPECPSIVSQYEDQFRPILTVRPGVTGWSQVAFAKESYILDDDDPLSHYLDGLLPQKLALDEMYAERGTFSIDAQILFWTTAAVILRKAVAVHRASGQMRLRKR